MRYGKQVRKKNDQKHKERMRERDKSEKDRKSASKTERKIEK